MGIEIQHFSPGTAKMIQNVKVAVDLPEEEIYAVLKECYMDPNEALLRLLDLDTFQEMKSKPGRRKEEAQESRPQVHNGGSNRGLTSDHIARSCGSTQTSYNELGESANKGQTVFAPPSPHSSVMGGNTNQQHSSQSDTLSTSSGDAISASVQVSPGNHSVQSKEKEVLFVDILSSNPRSCGSQRHTEENEEELGKAAYKGQNVFGAASPHSSVIGGSTNLQEPSSQSDSLSTSLGDAISASVQVSPRNQSVRSTTSSGRLSVGDMVKMGRNPSEGSHTSSLHQDETTEPFHNSGDTDRQNGFCDTRKETIYAEYNAPVHSQPEIGKHSILEPAGLKAGTSLLFSSNILRVCSGLSFARKEPKLSNMALTEDPEFGNLRTPENGKDAHSDGDTPYDGYVHEVVAPGVLQKIMRWIWPVFHLIVECVLAFFEIYGMGSRRWMVGGAVISAIAACFWVLEIARMHRTPFCFWRLPFIPEIFELITVLVQFAYFLLGYESLRHKREESFKGLLIRVCVYGLTFQTCSFLQRLGPRFC